LLLLAKNAEYYGRCGTINGILTIIQQENYRYFTVIVSQIRVEFAKPAFWQTFEVRDPREAPPLSTFIALDPFLRRCTSRNNFLVSTL